MTRKAIFLTLLVGGIAATALRGQHPSSPVVEQEEQRQATPTMLAFEALLCDTAYVENARAIKAGSKQAYDCKDPHDRDALMRIAAARP